MAHPLEKIIGYTFKDPGLLATALTHTSYANESRVPVAHNERLEFLGDSVLQIVSADYLFHAYADRPEGDLTRIRAALVCENSLVEVAQSLDLGSYLRHLLAQLLRRRGRHPRVAQGLLQIQLHPFTPPGGQASAGFI